MRNLVTYLLLAATVAKVAAVLALGPASIEMDAMGYWKLSGLVIDGDLFMMGEPIAYRTPAYPWFLAIDTAEKSPLDIRKPADQPQQTLPSYIAQARSVVVFERR